MSHGDRPFRKICLSTVANRLPSASACQKIMRMDLLGHRLVRPKHAAPKPPGWGAIRPRSCAATSIRFSPGWQVNHSHRQRSSRPFPFRDRLQCEA